MLRNTCLVAFLNPFKHLLFDSAVTMVRTYQDIASISLFKPSESYGLAALGSPQTYTPARLFRCLLPLRAQSPIHITDMEAVVWPVPPPARRDQAKHRGHVFQTCVFVRRIHLKRGLLPFRVAVEFRHNSMKSTAPQSWPRHCQAVAAADHIGNESLDSGLDGVDASALWCILKDSAACAPIARAAFLFDESEDVPSAPTTFSHLYWRTNLPRGEALCELYPPPSSASSGARPCSPLSLFS